MAVRVFAEQSLKMWLGQKCFLGDNNNRCGETKLEPHQNLMIFSESVSSFEKIYSRAGQLYEVLKPHCRMQVRQELHMNKL